MVTRQNILDAAVQVFLKHGFQRSAMQDVAERAGVTRGAVYWHFRNQLDVLEALLDVTQLPWQVLRPLPRPLLGSTPVAPLRQALARMAIAPLTCLEGSVPAQQLMRIVGEVNEPDSGARLGARLTSRLEADRAAGLHCLQMALAQTAASGALRPGTDPASAALGLFVLVDGLMHQWLRQPTAFRLTEVGTQAVQSHLAGLLLA
jgi:AcrR family transcriptional regulator